MNSERFRRLMDAVAGALERPADERERWLSERIADDEEMISEAAALLAFASRDSEDDADSLFGRVDRAASWFDAAGRRPPERIGPYRVLETLGEGGMGIVYGARQEEPLRRDVAIKVLRPGIHAPRIMARFESERRALASLDHPWIAHVFDAGTTGDGAPYFAMEWVRGPTISEYCDERRLALSDRLKLFRRVLQAVQHAHEQGIIHRDLKPSNILVTEVDGAPTPKVIDFGIARIDPGGADLTTAHTAMGAVLGTIEYMSPEQALSPAEGVGTRSDVYSLGVVLYELVTGVLPRGADALRNATPVQLEHLLRNTDPSPPSRRVTPQTDGSGTRAAARATNPVRLRRALRGDLDRIVAKALRGDPERRYASAAHFADDIERYLRGEPVSARPSTWSYRARRFGSRHRWGVAGVAAALVMLLSTAGVFTLRLAIARDEARTEAEKAIQIAELLQNVFSLPDPAAAGGGDGDVTARELLDAGAEQIVRDLPDQPELQAALLGVMARTYRGLGLWEEAAGRFESAIGIARSLGDGGREELAGQLHDLGVLRMDMGEWARADTVLREALEIRRRHFGEESAETASTMAALALGLRGRGRYDEAEELARAALAVHRNTLGPEDVELGTTLHTLGFVLRSQGDLEEATTHYREALAMRRRLLDPTHPDVLSTMGNLATVLEAQGRYTEAESLLREAHAGRRERLGSDHPQTILSLNNVAYLLWRTGQYGRADTLFAEVVDAGRRVYAGDSPQFAILLNNLGVARRRGLDLESAEELHIEALEMNRRLHGDEHPRVAADMDNLGRVLLARGRPRRAERLHRQALAMRTRLLGVDHPDVAESLSALAEARLALGAGVEADSLMRRALAIRTERLGERNPRTLATAHDLGALLAERGEVAEAERVLTAALDGRRAALDPEHPDIASTLATLGEVYLATGRPERARSALTEARRITTGRLGEEDPDTRRIDEALAELDRVSDGGDTTSGGPPTDGVASPR